MTAPPAMDDLLAHRARFLAFIRNRVRDPDEAEEILAEGWGGDLGR